MKKNNDTAVIAAAGAAVLLAASFLLDGVAAALIRSIQTQLITAAVAAFNKYFVWIYAALLAATAASILKAAAKEDRGRKILAMAASIITAMAVTHLLKPAIHRLRPDGMLFVNPLLGNIDLDYSFPSGHTTAAAAAAFSAPKAFRAVWLVFTAATILSRVYSNVHFLSDTAAGLIVAFAVSALIRNKLKKGITAQDNMEAKRQVMHALIGLAIAAFVWKYPHLWYAVIAVAAAGLVLSYLIKSAAGNEAVRKFRNLAVAALRLVERKEELQRFPGKGAIMLFLGAGITAAIFRKEAAAAIVILAVGDSVSHLAGRFFGRTNHRWLFAQEKTAEGSVFGFVFAAAAAATMLPVWLAIAAAAAGMAVEALHLRIGRLKIDDNLTVPLAAAAVIFASKLLINF